jgi:hypothetical protein
MWYLMIPFFSLRIHFLILFLRWNEFFFYQTLAALIHIMAKLKWFQNAGIVCYRHKRIQLKIILNCRIIKQHIFCPSNKVTRPTLRKDIRSKKEKEKINSIEIDIEQIKMMMKRRNQNLYESRLNWFQNIKSTQLYIEFIIFVFWIKKLIDGL